MNPSELSLEARDRCQRGLKHDRNSTKEKFSIIGFEGGRGTPGEGLGRLLGAEYSHQPTASKNQWDLQSYNETLNLTNSPYEPGTDSSQEPQRGTQHPVVTLSVRP